MSTARRSSKIIIDNRASKEQIQEAPVLKESSPEPQEKFKSAKGVKLHLNIGTTEIPSKEKQTDESIIKKLNRQLKEKEKVVKQIEDVKIDPKDLKLHVMAIIGEAKAKERLVQETLQDFRSFVQTLGVFLKEEEKMCSINGHINMLMQEWSNHHDIVINFSNTLVGQPDKIWICDEFFFYYDWLARATDRCSDILKMIGDAKVNCEVQINQFIIQVKYVKDDNTIKEEEQLMKEVRAMIDNLVNIQDINLIKEGIHVENQYKLAKWGYQLSEAHKRLTDLYNNVKPLVKIQRIGITKLEKFAEGDLPAKINMLGSATKLKEFA